MSTRHTAELAGDLPPEIEQDVLGKLHYVSEWASGFALRPGSRRSISFELRPGTTESPEAIAEKIASVAQKMTRAYRPGGGKVLVRRTVAVPHSEDPHPRLEEIGELRRYGSGRYGLGPRLTTLVEFFDVRLRQLGLDMGAVSHQFPSLIGAETLDRCRYLRTFPHSLTLVSHLREDLDAIQAFARTARWDGTKLEHAPDVVSAPETLLAPSVCFHYYAWIQDSVQPDPRVIGAVGKCFRFESGNLRGLERLWDFTMREVIFLGTSEHVLAHRQRALDATTALLDEWGLAYDIESATDPFFIEEFSTQATFQLAFDLKFEVRARLPYRDGSLAAASFNYHQDFFGRSFNINRAEGEAVHTGCIGFGLERVALAFLAQYGLDRTRWPAAVARGVPTW